MTDINLLEEELTGNGRAATNEGKDRIKSDVRVYVPDSRIVRRCSACHLVPAARISGSRCTVVVLLNRPCNQLWKDMA